ncbi:hypothetical protein VNI00_004650 [Paramarasmius palmivorus]|uniref:Uncharacterized protein n=1 Tax=Paramarasmius palmivorus TaxID=297713 RepID=A0AAW0DFK4_9AGAR
MPPTKGPLWVYFHQGEKQNSSQYKAYCYECLKQHRPADAPINVDVTDELMKAETWFNDAIAKTKSVLGEKTAMAAHLKKCLHVTKAAKKVAEREVPSKSNGKRVLGANDDSDDEAECLKKRRLEETAEKILKQTELKPFKGLDIPFTADQIPQLLAQFLRATLSANLPFHWVEDPEVITLFLMFRSMACDVIPERKYLLGKLLDNAHDNVEDMLVKLFKGLMATLRYRYSPIYTESHADKV